jgi:hypothetical protein
MRRLFTGFVVALTIGLVPWLALAGNQEVAEKIVKSLHSGGQLHHYKIGVKFQDGTTWLRGQVCSEEQMKLAVDLVSKMDGVQQVVNNLTVAPPAPAAAAALQQPGSVAALQAGPAAQSPAPEAGSNTTAPAPATATVTANLQPAANTFATEQMPRVSPVTGSNASYAAGLSPSASRLQQALDSVAQEQRSDRGEATTTVNFITTNAQAPARQVSATEEVAPSAVPAPTKAQRPIRIAYSQVDAGTPASATVAPAPVAAAAPAPVASGPAPVAGGPMPMTGSPMPMGAARIPVYAPTIPNGVAQARFDHPHLPNYAWPSYAAYPNYAGVTYPRQYSAAAWPYIGPFYPYPQVPLGWRKVCLEWEDGWWFLDFKDNHRSRW